MFFRRVKALIPTFEERQGALRQLGFEIARDSGGRVRVSRDGCAAVIEDEGNGITKVDKAGVVVGSEVGVLVHGGYQMLVRTPSGRTVPALAENLTALHAFEEDLREGLGVVSLYNLGLGTTCDQHHYDRVAGREHSGPTAPAH